MKQLKSSIIILSIVFEIKAQPHVVDFLFTNVTIITMADDQLLLDQNLAVKDGKIVAISSPPNDQIKPIKTIDLAGKYLLPSLADAHAHLPKEKQDLEKYLVLNLINGVTRIRSMRGAWRHAQWKDEFNAENSIYPRLILSTPAIGRGADPTDEELFNFICSGKSEGFDLIKLLSIKDEKLFLKLDSMSKVAELKLVGHFPANVSDDVIFGSNYNSFEHLGGLLENDTLTNSRIERSKANNISICPTLQWYMIAYGQYSVDYLNQQRGIEYVDSTTRQYWIDKTIAYRSDLGEKAFAEEVAKYEMEIKQRMKIINQVNKNGLNLLLSPDASTSFIVPGFGILEEMKLYKRAGLSNYEIIKSSTVNFSKHLNENDSGTIEEGNKADFIILNQNPLEYLEAFEEIEGIFLNNNYLDRQKIDQLSSQILAK